MSSGESSYRKYNRRYVESFVAKSDDLEKFPAPSQEDLDYLKEILKIDPDGDDDYPFVLDEALEEKLDNLRCGVVVPRSVIVSNANWYESAIRSGSEIAALEIEEEVIQIKKNLLMKRLKQKY